MNIILGLYCLVCGLSTYFFLKERKDMVFNDYIPLAISYVFLIVVTILIFTLTFIMLPYTFLYGFIKGLKNKISGDDK